MCFLRKNAVPWFRRLVTGHSPRMHGFDLGPVHARFVVGKLALGQVSFRILRCYPVSIIPSMFRTQLHLHATLIYQKEKRQKAGHLQTEQSSFGHVGELGTKLPSHLVFKCFISIYKRSFHDGQCAQEETLNSVGWRLPFQRHITNFLP